MTPDELLVTAKLADLDREITARHALARTLTELYGECRCDRRPRQQKVLCERHSVDPGLFRRLIWSGLGS